MEDFKLDILIGKGPTARSIRLDLPRFTLVGATTRTGLVAGPLRDRFGFVGRLDLYDVDELEAIVRRSAGILRRAHRRRGCPPDRRALPGHAAHRQPAAAPGARLRRGPGRGDDHLGRRRRRTRASSGSTSSGSTRSTGRSSTCSAGGSPVARSASPPSPSASARRPTPSRTPTSPTSSSRGSSNGPPGAGSPAPAAWAHLGLSPGRDPSALAVHADRSRLTVAGHGARGVGGATMGYVSVPPTSGRCRGSPVRPADRTPSPSRRDSDGRLRLRPARGRHRPGADRAADRRPASWSAPASTGDGPSPACHGGRPARRCSVPATCWWSTRPGCWPPGWPWSRPAVVGPRSCWSSRSPGGRRSGRPWSVRVVGCPAGSLLCSSPVGPGPVRWSRWAARSTGGGTAGAGPAPRPGASWAGPGSMPLPPYIHHPPGRPRPLPDRLRRRSRTSATARRPPRRPGCTSPPGCSRSAGRRGPAWPGWTWPSASTPSARSPHRPPRST